MEEKEGYPLTLTLSPVGRDEIITWVEIKKPSIIHFQDSRLLRKVKALAMTSTKMIAESTSNKLPSNEGKKKLPELLS